MPLKCSFQLIVILAATISLLNFLIIFIEFPTNRMSNEHQICIILPYRDRWDELQITVPKLAEFLHKQYILPHFIVVNQSDNLRFNRASLINIGYLEAERKGCDYMAIHDVDIVPLNPNLDYNFPGNGKLMHITAGKYHPITRYNYNNYIGGVLLMTIPDFRKINGMSNNFWGWGLEDDEFYLRLKKFDLADNISRPFNLSTNRTNTFLHLHEKRRDYRRNEYKRKRMRGLDRNSGLDSLKFITKRRSTIRIGNVDNLAILDVELICDLKRHPECVS